MMESYKNLVTGILGSYEKSDIKGEITAGGRSRAGRCNLVFSFTKESSPGV